jgi:hypothetical protein
MISFSEVKSDILNFDVLETLNTLVSILPDENEMLSVTI